MKDCKYHACNKQIKSSWANNMKINISWRCKKKKIRGDSEVWTSRRQIIIAGWGSTDTAEQCMNVFLTNKNTAAMKFTAGAISGLLHQFGRNQYWATEHAGAGINTWWYNHILLLDTVCAVHDTEEDELRVVKWRRGEEGDLRVWWWKITFILRNKATEERQWEWDRVCVCVGGGGV